MELKKVLEIHKYNGILWYIHPYIDSGKIVRKTVYSSKIKRYFHMFECFSLDGAFGKGVYHRGATPKEADEKNCCDIRIFTTKEEAKLAFYDQLYDPLGMND